MLVLFTLTVLCSATLLFFVQPMFARMVLPLLGGSPAVWNTALVFYQVALLAGYGYVHWATTRLSFQTQLLLHLVLLFTAAICLPIGVPSGWLPPTARNPVLPLLGLLTISVGLPFFLVSTTGPLLQKWFARTRHRLAPDPYFLYAASNIGSIAGLLCYPVWVEPHLRLGVQSQLWSTGYALLVLLTSGCALFVWGGVRRTIRLAIVPEPIRDSEPDVIEFASPVELGETSTVPLTKRRKLRWVLLAFAPSSLMMGVTAHITTDIAAVPLLWVLPLALYLLSFVLVFARRPLLPHAFVVRALPFFVLPLLIVMVGRPAQPILPIMGLHLLVLFLAAMVCHGELAQDRPPARFLTEFYLWLAVGGALGGVFNALVAPAVFDFILEYPLAVMLACMLRPPRSTTQAGRRERILDFALPIGVATLIVGTTLFLDSTGSQLTRPIVVLLVAALTFPILSFSRRPIRFGLAVGAVLLANPAEIDQRIRGLHSERSFFGLHRVVTDPSGQFHMLYDGSTLHGTQRIQPRACREPLGYYSRGGPLGEVMDAAKRSRPIRSVAVAGLGAGTIASYAEAGQRWTYFEIDPAVERIARDPRFFCYLAAAPADVQVVLGDARLSLAASRERYDLIVLDAYSSDAIPVHLLTREAMRVYLSHLSDGGMLVFHISNQYFRLAPVVARLAQEEGLACRVRRSGRVGDAETAAGVLPSVYAVVARRASDLGAIESDPNWKSEHVSSASPLWTDDFSSLFSVLRH